MSKGARLRAERMRVRNPLLTPYQRPRPGENIEIAISPGVTLDTDDAIKVMQKQTHDGLIVMLGGRRRSGVRWHHVHGCAEILAWLDKATLGTDWLTDDYGSNMSDVDQYRAFVHEHGDRAVLVVAMCEAVRP